MKTLRSPVSTRRSAKKTPTDHGSNSRCEGDLRVEDSSDCDKNQKEGDASGAPENSTGDSEGKVMPAGNTDGIFCDKGSSPSELAIGQGRSRIQKLDGNAYKPWGSRSRASSTGSDASFCKGGLGKTCGEPVRSSELGVSCDKCERWFHASCQGIPKPAYEALTKYKVLAWLCPDCKGSLKSQDSPSLTVLESKLDQLTSVVDNHMKQVGLSLKEQERALDDQAKLIERSITDNQNQRASYAEIVKGTCSDVVEKVSAKVSIIPQTIATRAASKDMQNIGHVFDEFLEKDKRKNNLVIHNLPESEVSSLAERTEKDIKLFKDVMRDTFKMNVAVSKAFRVGKVVQTRPRLLIITLATPGVKGDILRIAPQLRNSDTWGNIYITPDLTKTEREAARKVREELATRRAAGESNLTICKGKIVSVVQTDGHDVPSKIKEGPSSLGEASHTTPSVKPAAESEGTSTGQAGEGTRAESSESCSVRDGPNA